MRAFQAAGAAILLFLSACQDRPAPPTQLVLYNGKVFTASLERPWAEAIWVRGDRIALVGTTDEVRAAAGVSVPELDLRGRVVVPGLNDSHDHIHASVPAALISTGPDPLPDPVLAVVLDSLRAAVIRHPEGTRLEVSVGERILSDARARRAVLDRVAPRHPVVLRAWTGHGQILNSAALAAAGVADTVLDPLGGRYERDGAGRLTGLVEEYAGFRLFDSGGASDSAIIASFRSRAAEMVKWGVTSIQNMTTGFRPEQLARVLDSLDLPVRLRLIAFPLTGPSQRLTEPWQALRGTARVDVSGVKYVLDGTPVERLAVLRAPYSDRRNWHGRLNFPPDTLRAILEEALTAGEQPMIHAVGDSAIALVISTLSALAPDSVWRRLRPRIEHGEGLTPDLLGRAERLGIVVVQNPSHLALGVPLNTGRYGSRRAAMQPLKSLGAHGIMLALGSDGPLNPFLNIMFAVVHPDHPSEALTVEEAVRAYTLGSAFAEHRNLEKGTLTAGMYADLAVLSQDIFTVSPAELPATVSLFTMKGGVAVHDPNGWAAPLVIAERNR